MIRAWEAWQQIQRQRAHLAEIPIAQLAALTRNLQATGQPVPTRDFLVFVDPDDTRREFAPAVAATLLDLEREDRSHPLLRAVWQQVKDAATATAEAPEVRAWRSRCGEVWLICPTVEGQHVRAGLAACGTQDPGTVELFDVDRPLLTYRVVVPRRPCGGWFAAGMLLQLAAS